ncbi:hypothetical protein NUU61_000285 [Penicillium alfredii]|uniref:Major facilitator superfamily (MFS) profile domain-containing protein n=1 Tax=Penicillium alfredii TaxID=1506179 RepID=A0A9W9KQV3_9EURO|nr:uncharacterized protein NUU61_000285 [Penicillium alfredii]KAJ5114526.1 hypothetical protein NUU61_000285 [Penicillium alfredii]
MASASALFTASWGQTLTYLLAVCPFSIAFLVFINSSVSFVVTDLIGLQKGEGDAVGTLGFADELLALIACPLWGVLSDRIGVRHVCTIGYVIIAIALVLFVQATNIYPQLLLGRLLFSVGGSAVSTMVTAVLPTITGRALGAQPCQISVPSDQTFSPEQTSSQPHRGTADPVRDSSSARLSGFVARFEKMGLSPSQAIQRSYYLVAAVAVIIGLICFVGLRDLPGEQGKGWKALSNVSSHSSEQSEEEQHVAHVQPPRLPYWNQLTTAFLLGFRNRDIGLGYIGGFVARASSVGISLFIPLAVNHYYRASGLCDDHEPEPGTGLGDMKRACPRAYILASILTGVSQLVALLAAPAIGFLTDKSHRYHFPLLVGALVGIAGYVAFPLLPSPQFQGPGGNVAVFVVMALIGISQIGAIVCSLAVLSNGILQVNIDESSRKSTDRRIEPHVEPESQPLLAETGNELLQLSQLKGSIAGVYSLYGGAGILVLTKVGGWLFDALSSATPFYILAGFNGVLLVTGLGCGALNHLAPR